MYPNHSTRTAGFNPGPGGHAPALKIRPAERSPLLLLVRVWIGICRGDHRAVAESLAALDDIGWHLRIDRQWYLGGRP